MNLPPLIGLYASAPSSGKSTVASFLQTNYGYTILPLAAPLKTMGVVFLTTLGLHPDQAHDYIYNNKQARIPEVGVSARHLLQTLGTEWGRTCIHPEIWLRAWEAQLNQLPPNSRVVVDDVRFRNEADLVASRHFGLLWRINRPDAQRQTTHASEGDLDSYTDFDALIHNSGSIQDLHDLVANLLST